MDCAAVKMLDCMSGHGAGSVACKLVTPERAVDPPTTQKMVRVSVSHKKGPSQKHSRTPSIGCKADKKWESSIMSSLLYSSATSAPTMLTASQNGPREAFQIQLNIV